MKSFLKKGLFFIAGCLLPALLFSQGLKLNSVTAGFQLWSPSEKASLEEIEGLAKNVDDFTPFDLSKYQAVYFSIHSTSEEGVPFVLPDDPVNSKFLRKSRFYLQMGFVPYSKKREDYLTSRELKFGAYYQPYVYHNTGYLDLDTIRTDSLVGHYIYYTEWTPVAGLTADYVFKTDPTKRVGAYFGFGAAIGASLHPGILENYGSFAETIRTDSFSNGTASYPYFESLSDTKNNIPAAASLLLELRFPFGGSLAIAKNFSLLLNAEGKLSKQVYFNGASFPSRFGIAGTVGVNYQF